MRLFIIALTILSMCFYGCKNTQKSSHEHETAEEHAAHNHDHEHENHDHEHEGHNHEEEEHENGEGHSDEIIFTKAQAAKTDFEVKEIQPGTFHQIIKTTGQVLPAPGDESIIVATNNGVISYANNNQAEGSMVKQGQPLFYITSKHMGEGDYYTRIHANYEKAKAEYERAEKLCPPINRAILWASALREISLRVFHAASIFSIALCPAAMPATDIFSPWAV